MLVTEHVVLGVAEHEVEQSGHFLPDDAHIGFPRAVESCREQDIVLGFEHGDADRMNDAHTLHGVGQNAGQLVFESACAAGMQAAQHQLDAGLVCHGVQGGNQPLLDRGNDPEVRSAGQIARLDN